MPVNKGTDNFKAHRDKKVNKVCEMIDQNLMRLRRSKAKFSNFNSLATYLCSAISQALTIEHSHNSEGTPPKPISKSTLYRNKIYREKIILFLRQNHENSSLPLKSENLHSSIYEKENFELRAEVATLKNKIISLKRYIENKNVVDNPEEVVSKKISTSTQHMEKFHLTSSALQTLLEATEGQFIIENGQLVATSRIIDNIVVDKGTLSPFIEWINTNGKY
ncbi:hypothetical protein [Microbulbifer pacificus]|uniref:Uncharacterized protein n=1 Tax=Microbulbifer pacificus TaxID=407164 RepID=A0AAU0N4K2_9GAMM|nr:hypothetical protein [Microbulbifer pacificus]WOX07034.1 hypothetical protein R5R33_07850 [Microbulbifer pacificus]